MISLARDAMNNDHPVGIGSSHSEVWWRHAGTISCPLTTLFAKMFSLKRALPASSSLNQQGSALFAALLLEITQTPHDFFHLTSSFYHAHPFNYTNSACLATPA
jgi:hypothetical protein